LIYNLVWKKVRFFIQENVQLPLTTNGQVVIASTVANLSSSITIYF